MSEYVQWPAGFSPSECPVHAVNEIDISSSPEVVWKLLIHVTKWPTYYSNASDIDVKGDSKELGLGVRFAWKPSPAVSMSLQSVVREWEPERRIGWEVLNEDAEAYHAWVITPTKEGCHVHTEETQKGKFWEEVQEKHPGALRDVHQEWVEALQEAAQ